MVIVVQSHMTPGPKAFDTVDDCFHPLEPDSGPDSASDAQTVIDVGR